MPFGFKTCMVDSHLQIDDLLQFLLFFSLIFLSSLFAAYFAASDSLLLSLALATIVATKIRFRLVFFRRLSFQLPSWCSFKLMFFLFKRHDENSENLPAAINYQ